MVVRLIYIGGQGRLGGPFGPCSQGVQVGQGGQCCPGGQGGPGGLGGYCGQPG